MARGLAEAGMGRGKARRKSTSLAQYHLQPDQIRRLILSADSDRDRTLVLLLAQTGMRRSEAASLRIEDVRYDELELVIRSGKGGKSRVIPVTPVLADSLRKLSADKLEGYYFRSRNHGHLTSRQINRIIARTGLRAGISNPNPNRNSVTCHLLRHSFARLWKANGGDIETLARILGHASVKTTWDLYGTQSQSDVRRNYKSTMSKLKLLP